MRIEIDTIVFDFKIMKEHDPEEINAKPEFGSYIYGLFIEASNWSSERHCLVESAPKVLFNKVPMIWLSPTKMGEKDPKRHVSARLLQDYSCPVYKTSKRAGTLSTTGHSTNYVLSIDLPIDKKHTQEHWIKRGVAMLCQLDD